MISMGITILLLVVIAHTCTANNNNSVCLLHPSCSNPNSSSTVNDSDCCLPVITTRILEFPNSACLLHPSCYSKPNSSRTINDSDCCLPGITEHVMEGPNSDCCRDDISYVLEARPIVPVQPQVSVCSLHPSCYSYPNFSTTYNGYDCCPLDITAPDGSGMMEPDGSGMMEVTNSDCSRCASGPNYKLSSALPEIWNISGQSADFLKGLIVTRVMPSFYIFVILISLPLNALALVTFTCKIKVKKPAVIYMSHLVCVDLFFTLLLPLKIHYQLNASDWVFGEVACRVLSAAYYCYMYCSILLMMCMSVDRLLAVALPIASLNWRSARKATCVCVLVWLLALAGTVPILSVRQTFKIKDVGVTCHDVLYQTQTYVYLFSILSCLYFFLPLVVTLVSYFTIIYVLSAKSDRLAKSSSSGNRKRAVIMVITVLMEFVMCFAPTNGILLYHCVRLATGGTRGEGDSSYAVYLLAVCFGSASVFLDPLLYYYGSSQCRQQIRSVFLCRKAKKANTPSN